MSNGKQKNFRLSKPAVALLKRLSKESKATETDVVEHCVARYALELGVMTDQARELLVKNLATAIAAKPSATHGDEEPLKNLLRKRVRSSSAAAS